VLISLSHIFFQMKQIIKSIRKPQIVIQDDYYEMSRSEQVVIIRKVPGMMQELTKKKRVSKHQRDFEDDINEVGIRARERDSFRRTVISQKIIIDEYRTYP
jgi:hypothetical protein